MSSPTSSISSLELDNLSLDGLAACDSSCDADHSKSSFPVIQPEDFHDVVVIGAGPNGLALVSRLCEVNPPSIYTDLEHARLSWLGGHQHAKVSGRQRKLVGRKSSSGAGKNPNVAVFDAAGDEWMNTWKNVGFSCSLASHIA